MQVFTRCILELAPCLDRTFLPLAYPDLARNIRWLILFIRQEKIFRRIQSEAAISRSILPTSDSNQIVKPQLFDKMVLFVLTYILFRIEDV